MPVIKKAVARRFLLLLLALLCSIVLIEARPNDNNKDSPEFIRQQLRQALSKCNSRQAPPTHKVMLREKSAVCNDGSPAGYYIRKSYGSKRWVVFLEGGWYCYDKRSCESRWTRSRSFMTSAGWPDTRQVSGILSPDPEENPFWWNANHVYVPYCSSDSWSGSSPAGGSSRFAFMGSSIVLEVMRDLLPHGVMNASKLMLTGSSAGGTGVMLNLDRITEFLAGQGSSAEVRGVTDSGWFLDNAPYATADCHDPQRCAPITAIQMGYSLWNGQVPAACRSQYIDQPWRCYFGHHLHRTLKTPLFIFQWLFDEAQMLADNVGPPMSKEQWDYIHAVGDDLRRTFANVSAVFSPSCISHTVLTKRDWQSVRIGEVSLPQALRCWELQPYWSISNHLFPQSGNHRHRHHHNHHSHEAKRSDAAAAAAAAADYDQSEPTAAHRHKQHNSTPPLPANPLVLLADDPEMPANVPPAKPARNLVRSGQQLTTEPNATLVESPLAGRNASRRRDERRKGAGRKNGGGGGKKPGQTGKRSALPDRNNATATPPGNGAKKISNKTSRINQDRSKAHNRRNKDRKRKKDNNNQRSAARLKRWETQFERSYAGQEVCDHRLVDKCTWPQCNRICPKLHNPFTGEEMDFIQLLKSFGLDMTSVANALGIDMHTLNNMDHEVLLHLLTQQTN